VCAFLKLKAIGSSEAEDFFKGRASMESPEITMITSPEEMRALASWYRERAELTENPTIWESRLRTAEDLLEKAMQAECRRPPDSRDPHLGGPLCSSTHRLWRRGLRARCDK
jgi:hypothetical protein